MLGFAWLSPTYVLVIEQMIQRTLERAQQQLAGKVNGEETEIRVDCFVAGHRMFVFENSNGVILSVAMTRGKMWEYFFYSLVSFQEFLPCLLIAQKKQSRFSRKNGASSRAQCAAKGRGQFKTKSFSSVNITAET